MFNIGAQFNAAYRRQQRNSSRMINARYSWLQIKRQAQFAKARAWLNQS